MIYKKFSIYSSAIWSYCAIIATFMVNFNLGSSSLMCSNWKKLLFQFVVLRVYILYLPLQYNYCCNKIMNINFTHKLLQEISPIIEIKWPPE